MVLIKKLLIRNVTSKKQFGFFFFTFSVQVQQKNLSKKKAQK